MFYDKLFDFFDSIPTVTFIAWFTPIYFSLHYFAFRLLLLHPRFQGVSLDKQTFILINCMESLLLALMRYIYSLFSLSIHKLLLFSFIGLNAVYRGDVSILDTMKHAPNPQIMINMATMYVVKDLANILINKRIAATTVLHHICVFIAYVYVLR